VLDARVLKVAGHNLDAGEQLRTEAEAGPGWGRMSLTLQPQTQVELYLQQDAYPDLVLSHEGGVLCLEHRREGQNGDERFDRFFPHDFSLTVGEGKELTLEWLCDHGSLEILLQQGQVSLTSLSISPQGGCAPVVAVTQGQCCIESLEYAGLAFGDRNDLRAQA
jgi:fructan beta-fructosidase